MITKAMRDLGFRREEVVVVGDIDGNMGAAAGKFLLWYRWIVRSPDKRRRPKEQRPVAGARRLRSSSDPQIAEASNREVAPGASDQSEFAPDRRRANLHRHIKEFNISGMTNFGVDTNGVVESINNALRLRMRFVNELLT
jgi:hypothetical protein